MKKIIKSIQKLSSFPKCVRKWEGDSKKGMLPYISWRSYSWDERTSSGNPIPREIPFQLQVLFWFFLGYSNIFAADFLKEARCQ